MFRKLFYELLAEKRLSRWFPTLCIQQICRRSLIQWGFAIQYELGVPNSKKEITIRSAPQMQELIDQAVAKDVANVDCTTSHAPASWVHLLKQKIYNAYLCNTDDFRKYIYK